VSGYLEVLDAQRQQYDAQLNLAGAVRDELTAVVQLYRALGGGWREVEQAPPGQPPASGGAPTPPAQGAGGTPTGAALASPEVMAGP
jgi:hypothetical protein